MKRLSILLLASFLAIAGAWAAPEEDLSAGIKAYREGDYEKALPLVRKAAEAGHASAVIWTDYLVGNIAYRDGDLLGALKPLRKAADAGLAEAQALYAYALNKGDENPEAVRYYEMAIKQGNADAKFGLAAMYIGGEGVKHDLGEAKRLIFEAAESGHRQAILVVVNALIGESSPLPLTDADKEPKKIGVWLVKALEQEELPLMRRLEAAYRTGGYGLDVNIAEADRLAKRIAELTGETEENLKKRKRRRR